jgi:hypothetical protein
MDEGESVDDLESIKTKEYETEGWSRSGSPAEMDTDG